MARQANLAEYLLGVGVPLVRSGSRYRHKEHNSLIFTDNAYYWNSRGEHGNAIDYLMRHMNMDFKSAILALTNTSISQTTKQSMKPFALDNSKLQNNQNKVRRYLNTIRNIGFSIISHLTEKNLLHQEKRTNNAIFSIYDENNICVGAEVQGITSKRFKGIKKNSKYGYGFNVRFSENDTYDYALFFESAIDLISFIDYKHNHEKKNLNSCILVSMSGLKLNVIKNTVAVFKGNMGVVLCVDNDNAGAMFINKVENAKIPYIKRLPDKKFKDWNEQLTFTKMQKRPISRLYEITR
ncbi:MAG: DUF3991 and toprim domain-containing protein [Defluviitaleaceae bacterium]|nr:DUF3991 and toprim domain-containing protein [Defluviitaleaceae bacterium]